MSDPIRSVVAEHLRKYPITEAEREQLARAETADYAGLWHRGENGRWEKSR